MVHAVRSGNGNRQYGDKNRDWLTQAALGQVTVPFDDHSALALHLAIAEENGNAGYLRDTLKSSMADEQHRSIATALAVVCVHCPHLTTAPRTHTHSHT